MHLLRRVLLGEGVAVPSEAGTRGERA
jgi:hypothetical protein